LFQDSIKYNYFAHHLAHSPQMTRSWTTAQLRLIINPSSVPASHHLLMRPHCGTKTDYGGNWKVSVEQVRSLDTKLKIHHLNYLHLSAETEDVSK